LIETLANNWQTKEGFEILFKQHYESLCGFVFGMVKDFDASEEIVQELFVRLWEKRNDIPDDISMKAYLYRAARNRTLNQIKHLEIREDFKLFNRNEMADAEQNNGNPAEMSELQRMITQAINKLPTERKKIFLMSREEGLKYKEIAEKLDISIKTVENQMGKALFTLRTELSDYLPAVIIAICIGIH